MDVCLVGNGPISKEDRRFINSEACHRVVRFNDMKNMLEGERCDVHVVRSNGTGFWGLVNPPKIDVGRVPLLQIGGSRAPTKGGEEVLAVLDNESTRIYPSCTHNQRATTKTFTSGALVMSHYNEKPSVRTIHVFGMNFLPARNNTHDVDREKAMHESCCHKCQIHSTPRQTYYP